MRENLMPTKKKLEHWQVVTLMLMAYDFLAVIVSYFLALWIRFDCKFSEIEPHYLHTYYRTIIIYALFCVVVFQVYKTLQKYMEICQLFRAFESSPCNGCNGNGIYQRYFPFCGENADFLLCVWTFDSVYFDAGNPLFLPLCPFVKRKKKRRSP